MAFIGLTAVIVFIVNTSPSKARRLKRRLLSPCPSNPDVSGFPDGASFAEALEEGETEIKLCPGVLFEEQFTINPLEESSISVSCADLTEPCIWDGKRGPNLIFQGDGPLKLRVKGIKFTGATDTSIAVQANEGSVLEFINCTWNGNEGLGAFDLGRKAPNSRDEPVSNSSGSSRRRWHAGKKSSQNVRSQLYLSNCVFEENVASSSILFVDRADLLMEDCAFVNNNAQSALINLVGGSHNISGVVFEGNVVKESGLIFFDETAHLNKESICGQNNTVEAFCNGSFQELIDPTSCIDGKNEQLCNSACNIFDECSTNEDCVSSIKDLTNALQRGGDIDLCSDSVFDLSASSKPLIIENKPTALKCNKNCVFYGGNRQFRVLDGAVSVSFRKITFKNSEMASIIVEVDLSEPSLILFIDCEWYGHTGKHILLIDPPGPLEENDQLQAFVTIEDSIFLANSVEEYLISNGGVGLSVNSCEFRGNYFSRSILGALGGETTFGSSEPSERIMSGKTILDSNDVQAGLIFVGLENSIFLPGNVCATNNTSASSCNGTFYETLDTTDCRGGASNGKSCKDECEPIDNCDPIEEIGFANCFSDWTKLVQSISSSRSGQAFVVCPGSDFVLNANDTLYLGMDETILRCGNDGKRSNRCMVTGGDVQIEISGSASGIIVEGMSFVGSTNVSVAALGNRDSKATISNCEFSGHSGEAAIIVVDQNGDFQTNASHPESMLLNIDDCIFEGNNVELAPIVNFQGDVRVTRTEFKSNIGLSGAGGLLSYSKLSVSKSCFIGNNGNVSGSIVLSAKAAQAFKQSENFGDENNALIGNCSSIFTLDELWECEEFESTECHATPATSSPAPSLSEDPPDAPSTSPPTAVGPCFSSEEWEDVFRAISKSSGYETFTLCDNTFIDMAAMEALGMAPLVVSASGLTFRCGSERRNGCILSGGSGHIVLKDNVESFRVRGVTMVNASNASIVGDLREPFAIEFEACEWKYNSGVAIVHIESSVHSSEEKGKHSKTSFRRDEMALNEHSFVCDQCLFDGNVVTGSILSFDLVSLVLDAVIFQGNRFDGDLLFIKNGSVALMDSCVLDSKSKGGLVRADAGQVSIENAYLSGNKFSGCAGWAGSEGKCEELTSTKKCIAEEKRCYSDWLDLADSISNSSQGRVFTICNGATLEVTNSPAIKISRSKTALRCGLSGARSGNCLVTGGEVQFQILGTVTGIVFSGITFSNATVAAVNGAGKYGSEAKIIDCVFENMATGQAALLVFPGAIPKSTAPDRRLTIEDFSDSFGLGMKVKIAYSSFVSNAVELAAIANLNSTIEVIDCAFNRNKGTAGAIGQWFGGSTTLSTSCFTDNSGVIAGSVFVDGSEITQANNFGKGNKASDGACGTIFQSNGSGSDSSQSGVCLEFSESRCESKRAPTLAPSRAPTLPGGEPSGAQSQFDCVDDWANLVDVIAGDFSNASKSIFRLCPNATLKVGEDTVLLDQAGGDILIACGLDGRLRDNCTISGGQIQFRIAAKRINVEFRGVNFERSKAMSIVAAADSGSTAVFDECRWTGHSGEGVVLIYNDESGQKFDEATSISDLPGTSESMSTKFAKCVFIENSVTYAAVINIGGSSTISLTSFRTHQDLVAATIVTRSDAELSLERCCFVENDSILPGVVLMTEKSKLMKNEDNFGFDNRVGLSGCSDIWTVPSAEECSPTACPGDCFTFDSVECDIPSFDFGFPSSSPTGLPSDSSSSLSSPPALSEFDVTTTTLLASGFVFQNLFIAALVAMMGFGSFFYCKHQHESKKATKARPISPENDLPLESSHNERFQHDNLIIQASGSVILDPDVLTKKQSKLNTRGRFFGQSGKVRESREQQPLFSDPVGSTRSFSDYNQSVSYDKQDDRSRSSDDDSQSEIMLS